MSVKVITAVLRLGPGAVTSSERLVLYALAWHADDAGLNAWPSVPTLARETSLTPRAVQKVLRRLNAKGVLFVQARAARGSVRYGVDLQVLDRERAASAGAVDCEPGSQSGHVETPITANHVQGTANQVHPTANVVHPTANQVHPIRPLTVHEPSEKKNLAAAPRISLPDDDHEEAAGAAALTRLAHDTFDDLGEAAPFPALAAAFIGRLTGRQAANNQILDNLGAFFFSVRRQRRAATGRGTVAGSG
jgi:hypothetical protein